MKFLVVYDGENLSKRCTILKEHNIEYSVYTIEERVKLCVLLYTFLRALVFPEFLLLAETYYVALDKKA